MLRSGRFNAGNWPRTECTGGWVGPRTGLENFAPPSPLGFDPQTLRPVASRYYDYAVPNLTKHYIIIIIIIIIMQCNNNFTGKYLAIIGPKLSGPPGDPNYQGTTVYKQGKAFHGTKCHRRVEVWLQARMFQPHGKSALHLMNKRLGGPRNQSVRYGE